MSYHDPIDRSVAWVIEQRLAEAGNRYWKEVSFPEVQSVRFSTGPVFLNYEAHPNTYFLNYEAHPNTYFVLDEPTEAPVDRRSRWEFGLISEEEAMSWHVTTTIDGDSPKDELAGLRSEVLTQNPDAADQFEAAKDAAHAIVASGGAGGPTKKFVVAMWGHANPGHEPRPGWADDLIVVSVAQAKF